MNNKRISAELERLAREIVAMTDVLYHGTSNEGYGKRILSEGVLKAGDLIIERSGFAKPVAGRVYLTQKIREAVMYAIGGDMLGVELDKEIEDMIRREGKYGYVFEVRGSDIKEGQPDEDDLGGLLYNGVWEMKLAERAGGESKYSRCPKWLMDLAKSDLTLKQYEEMFEDGYKWWNNLAKKLAKSMKEWMKKELIDKYSIAVAHSGSIVIQKAWRFDKMKIVDLKKDGSNFFDLAEKVL